MKCPGCGTEMERSEDDKMIHWECPKCGATRDERK